jgi:hypothetical protein
MGFEGLRKPRQQGSGATIPIVRPCCRVPIKRGIECALTLHLFCCVLAMDLHVDSNKPLCGAVVVRRDFASARSRIAYIMPRSLLAPEIGAHPRLLSSQVKRKNGFEKERGTQNSVIDDIPDQRAS